MPFDPQKSQDTLRNHVLNIYSRTSFEEALGGRFLGSLGDAMANNGVESCLIGEFDTSRLLLQRAERFLSASLQNQENDPGRDILLSDLQLSQWLCGQHPNRKDCEEGVSWKESWFHERTAIDKLEVQLALTLYFEAQRFETLLNRFESTRLAKPKNLQRIQSEGTMCYVMARQRLGLEYSAEEITEAIESFLRRRVPDWLGNGLFTTTARWLKIAHWKSGDDPIATVLKAYDYLPDLDPPLYPPMAGS